MGARAQVRAIARWWKANREENAGLFREELAAAAEILARFPAAGPVYEVIGAREVRRLLLRRTRHHVYFTVDDERSVVTLLAVWHTSRGAKPPL